MGCTCRVLRPCDVKTWCRGVARRVRGTFHLRFPPQVRVPRVPQEGDTMSCAAELDDTVVLAMGGNMVRGAKQSKLFLLPGRSFGS
jgi:hypothetical protein